jgi:FlaA1/EpsC-like NDP-sugar epimerase
MLAIPSATRKRRREIVELMQPLGVKVRTIPGLMDLASGKVQVSALRALEIEDLLGRDVAMPNEILFSRNILGKTVLVTGAGGSIGSELCRQILAARPQVLLLVELSEYALYAIDAELRALAGEGGARIVPMLASVRDEARMRAILSAWRPETIYHAAAYKHVPLVEHNPAEGVLNNVFGTMTAARLAIDTGVSDFVLISTDKAVRPTNVMGTTKRLAELCLQALAAGKSSTRFSMVRFGNVLGSSGSVVPLFRAQIAAGGPVTITHADVTRYFMTIPEAAQLVIQAGAMATGGEVFILDMGEPVKIADLARKMIELSGLSVRDAGDVEGDIAIEVVGLRPGEKLYEELLIGENPSPTAHPLIMKATETHLPLVRLDQELARLTKAIEANDAQDLLAVLRDVVPEFAPASDVVDWVHMKRAS